MRLTFPHEPAVYLGLIRAILVVGTSFGFSLTADQTLAVYGLVEAITSLVQRQTVTPNAKLSEATMARAELSPPGPPA
jgi:hypothetical protein